MIIQFNILKTGSEHAVVTVCTIIDSLLQGNENRSKNCRKRMNSRTYREHVVTHGGHKRLAEAHNQKPLTEVLSFA